MSNAVNVYLLWHHRCFEGESLAHSVFDWFQFSHDITGGQAIQVLYRTLPEEEGNFQEVPHVVGIVVVLIDANMVAARQWRDYLAVTATTARNSNRKMAILPVALDDTAFRIPDFANCNYLNLESLRDPRNIDPAVRQGPRAIRLRRRLTEFCCQHILAVLTDNPESSWIRVFLSHAKVDGLRQADEMRSVLTQYGQLKHFFDESDIPLAQEFGKVITDAVQDGEACVLAIITNEFVNRPWCREEIRQARVPRFDDRVWYRPPVLLAYHFTGGGVTQQVADFGNYSVVALDGTEQTYALAVDRLICEVLLYLCLRLQAHNLSVTDADDADVTYITWIPDPMSILELTQNPKKLPIGKRIVYPGIGMSLMEIARLQELFPDLQFETYSECRRRLWKAEWLNPAEMVQT